MLLLLTMLVAPAVIGTLQPKATASDLAFMTGCWRMERNNRVVEEHWLAPAGGTLMGVSRTVAGGKTTEFEFLQIREQGGSLAYIAKPSGQPEATFMLASRTADEVAFENPTHDFPQRISYRRTTDGLQARVEGKMGGQARGFDLPYLRVNCTP
jgi:hypothetical protein